MRVLGIDDSVLFRKLLREVFTHFPQVLLFKTACSGTQALEMLKTESFDLIFCDLNMPSMNGVEFISKARLANHHMPICLLSASSTQEIKASLEAVSLGAVEYIVKPTNTEGLLPSELMRRTLAPYIARFMTNQSTLSSAQVGSTPTGIRTDQVAMDCIAIGSSTGGPKALYTLLSQLKGIKVPIFIAQHMPAEFVQSFVRHLSEECEFPVVAGAKGEMITPGQCYVSQSAMSMIITTMRNEKYISYSQEPGPNAIYPSVNALMSSVAQAYGASCLSIVLTGMGDDGRLGCQLVRKAGGTVISQSKESCVVYGMPAAVAKNGISQGEYSLNELANIINQLNSNRLNKRKSA